MEGNAVRLADVSAAGATPADAPPAIAKDIPAAPQAGKAIFRRFRFATCFARAIVDTPCTCEQIPSGYRNVSTFFSALPRRKAPGTRQPAIHVASVPTPVLNHRSPSRRQYVTGIVRGRDESHGGNHNDRDAPGDGFMDGQSFSPLAANSRAHCFDNDTMRPLDALIESS